MLHFVFLASVLLAVAALAAAGFGDASAGILLPLLVGIASVSVFIYAELRMYSRAKAILNADVATRRRYWILAGLFYLVIVAGIALGGLASRSLGPALTSAMLSMGVWIGFSLLAAIGWLRGRLMKRLREGEK